MPPRAGREVGDIGHRGVRVEPQGAGQVSVEVVAGRGQAPRGYARERVGEQLAVEDVAPRRCADDADEPAARRTELVEQAAGCARGEIDAVVHEDGADRGVGGDAGQLVGGAGTTDDTQRGDRDRHGEQDRARR